jgi:hypothetical protein
MNNLHTTLAVHPKIVNLDEAVIRINQNKIFAKIRAELFPEFEDQKMAFGFIQILSTTSALVSVDFFANLESDQITNVDCDPIFLIKEMEFESTQNLIMSVLFVLNFASDKNKIQFTEIAKFENNIQKLIEFLNIFEKIKIEDLYIEEYKILFNTAIFSKSSLVSIKPVHYLGYFKGEDDEYLNSLTVNFIDKTKVMVLSGTSNEFGGMWYFPPISSKH